MIVLLQIRVKPVVSCAESVKLNPCFGRHVESWWRVYETERCGYETERCETERTRAVVVSEVLHERS